MAATWKSRTLIPADAFEAGSVFLGEGRGVGFVNGFDGILDFRAAFQDADELPIRGAPPPLMRKSTSV